MLSHLLSRLFHAGGHRCMSRCEAFLCSVYKKETDYWKLLMLNIVMQLFKHSFTPCPLVSAQSPLQRTAAFWCPQRQGRNTSASSFWGFQAGRKKNFFLNVILMILFRGQKVQPQLKMPYLHITFQQVCHDDLDEEGKV